MDGLRLRVQTRWTDHLGKEIVETGDESQRVPFRKYYGPPDRGCI